MRWAYEGHRTTTAIFRRVEEIKRGSGEIKLNPSIKRGITRTEGFVMEIIENDPEHMTKWKEK